MKYLPSGSHIKLPVDIKISGEFTTPNSPVRVSYQVLGVDYSAEIHPGETSQIEVDLVIPELQIGELNYLNLTVSCSTPIGYFRFQKVYPIFNYADLYTDAEAVRNFLGLREFEYLDSEFDLEGAYFKIITLFKASFHPARALNPYLSKKLGDLIALSEAIRVAPTMLIRLSDKEETENGKYQRWGDPKYFDKLLGSVQDQYFDLLADLDEYLIVDAATSLALITPAFIPMLHHATGQTS